MPAIYETAVNNSRLDAVTTAIGVAGRLELLSATSDVLVSVTLSNPAAAPATGGLLTFADFPKYDSSADDTGTLALARVVTGGGQNIITGLTVGTSNADIIVDVLDVDAGQVVKIGYLVLDDNPAPETVVTGELDVTLDALTAAGAVISLSSVALKINPNGTVLRIDTDVALQLYDFNRGVLGAIGRIMSPVALTGQGAIDVDGALDATVDLISVSGSSAVTATQRWVTPAGDDGNTGLSEEQAYLTLSAGMAAAQPGDILNVKAGNYDTQLLHSVRAGTAVDPITVRGYTATPGDNPSYTNWRAGVYSTPDAALMPVLDAGSENNATMGILVQHDHVHVSGFTVRRHQWGAYVNPVDGFGLERIYTVEHGRTDAGYDAGAGMGIFLSQLATNGTVQDCSVVNANAQAFTIACDTSTIAGNESSCNNTEVIQGDAAGGPTDYYFTISGSNNTITNTRIERVGALYHGGHGLEIKAALGPATGNVIDGFTAINMDAGGIGCRHSDGTYNTFRNGTITGGHGIIVGDGSSQNTFEDITITGSGMGIWFSDSGEDENDGGISASNTIFRRITFNSVTWVLGYHTYATNTSTINGNTFDDLTVNGASYFYRQGRPADSNNVVSNSVLNNIPILADIMNASVNDTTDAGNNTFNNCGFSAVGTVSAPSADYTYIKSLLDGFAYFPRTSWYTRPKNPSLPEYSRPNDQGFVNPTPELMTVVDGYNRMPGLAGLTRAFEATGNEYYAQLAYDAAMDYVDAGRQQTPDTFLDWWAGWYSSSAIGTAWEGYNHDHYEWRAAAGVGHVLTMLIDNPGLNVSTAGNRLELAEFLRDHCWLKWQVYAIESGNASESNVINHKGHDDLGRIIMWVVALDKYYEGSTYLNWINNQGALFCDSFDTHTVNGRTEWIDRHVYTATSTVVQDTSHGSQSPQSLTYLYEHGYTNIATLTRILALKRGLDEVIWRGSGFASYTDGTGAVNSSTYGKNMGGWFSLLKYDQTNLGAYVDWVQANPNGILTSNGATCKAEWGAWMTGALMRALAP